MLSCREIHTLLGASFTNVLKVHGFLKTKLTWRHDVGQISHIVNLQKSAWDPDPHHCSYYINLRVVFRTAGNPNSGIISARLAMIAPEYGDSLLQFEGCDPAE